MGDLALDHILELRHNSEFREKVIRNFRQKFMVPENAKYEFSTNEPIPEIFVNSYMGAAIHLHLEKDQILYSLRNTNLEKIQQ